MEGAGEIRCMEKTKTEREKKNEIKREERRRREKQRRRRRTEVVDWLPPEILLFRLLGVSLLSPAAPSTFLLADI